MKFHGLFVGIDQYQSPLISNLTCSSRDAEAFFGLFEDSFGSGNSILLKNENATKTAIEEQFSTRLHNVHVDDVVVLLFSGHGSDDHHLITYDADPFDLDHTAIPMEELTKLFSLIPAKNVILFLDCCFAGGAGAKVFNVEYGKKSVTETAEEKLKKISGEGRIIFTAAQLDQEAIEDRRRGHSIFSYFLLEGLKGAPEVLKSGKISFLSLVEFVTQKVISATSQIRHKQEPGIRGVVDSDFHLPILEMGKVFNSFFPNTVTKKIGPDIEELKIFGFPDPLLSIWKGTIPSLNELQQAAINDYGIFNSNHLLVSAPTSSGKTMVGELAALKAYLKRERVYFLLPLRALVNDKYEEFVNKYSSFGLRIIRSTGEIEDDNAALMRGKFDIALLTYEKFSALALVNPHILKQVGLIVIDEVQMIADATRGINLEFLLTMLKTQRQMGVEPQLIALSAVIGDTHGLEDWLSGRLLRTDKRPVPLQEGVLSMDGAFHFLDDARNEQTTPRYSMPEFRKGSSQDIIIPLVKKLVSDGEKIIVFRETKPIVRATAKYLSESLGLKSCDEVIEKLPTGDPSEASSLLRLCLQGGIAFHNADLDRAERACIENAFRDPNSDLKVLVSTTTLAMGINTPAWSVIIAGLEHPGKVPYSKAEYKNMAGRAGRLGYSATGKSFLIAASEGEAYNLWQEYVLGKPEDVVSRFAESEPMSTICKVLATAAASKVSQMTQEGILAFIEESFASFTSRRRTNEAIWDEEVIVAATQDLLRHGLIELNNNQYSLTALGKVAGSSGIQVSSVVKIIEALQQVNLSEINDAALISLAQVTEELIEVNFPIHKRSHQERDRWQGAFARQIIPNSISRVLRNSNGEEWELTHKCKKIAAALMWIQGVELNKLEASLLQHMPSENAAGPIRSVAERSRDMLEPIGKIITILQGNSAEVAKRLEELGTRLEIGIPSNIAWLGKLVGRKLDRSDYLILSKSAFTTPEQLFSAQTKQLSDILKAPQIEEIQLAKIKWEEQKNKDNKITQLPMPAVE